MRDVIEPDADSLVEIVMIRAIEALMRRNYVRVSRRNRQTDFRNGFLIIVLPAYDVPANNLNDRSILR